MASRSPYNDRYKVEQKGKTRRSASSSKPKRDLADLTPADSPKKKAAAKKPWWGRAPAANPVAVLEPTPKMKQLRKIWWMLWGASLAVALVIVLVGKPGGPFEQYVSIAWGLWAASMAGAFYLEFGPIRKARIEAMEGARNGGKPSKADAKKAASAAKDAGDAPKPGDK